MLAQMWETIKTCMNVLEGSFCIQGRVSCEFTESLHFSAGYLF
jgi:hypothetical protein